MKFQTTVLAACAALIAQAAFAASPTLPRGGVWQPTAAEIGPQCDATIADARARIEKIKALPLKQANAKTVLSAWNALDIALEDLAGPAELLQETHPDAKVREAAEACGLKISALPNEYLQSEALYQRVAAVKTNNAIDAMARQSILDDFKERGVNLAPKDRERVKAIFEQLDKLAADFNRNTRDTATKLAFSEADLKGIPANMLNGRAKDAQGNYLFGLDYPERSAIMGFVEVESTRQAFYMAFNQRGGQANLDILKQATVLRLELAKLMGDTNYADWATKRRMAGSAAAVNKFLDDVQARVATIERKEIDELRQEKVAFTGKADAELKSWDTNFFEQRLKKARYSVDQNEVRAQFPTEPTIAWMMKVTSTLYGVNFVPNKNLAVWQADVRAYDVTDAKSGKYLSSFYLDLFPRDGKYKHAAAFPVRHTSLAAKRTAVSALVTNFSRDGFDQGELRTLFHEFGHIMHGVLSQTRYVLNSGTSTKRDFVEAPSQMYEAWATRPETLAMFASVCATCKPIDMKLMERMEASRAFGQGRRYATQRLYAAYDMSLHTANAVDPLQAWIDISKKTPLGYDAGSLFPAAFGHLMGGYQAGYYGYMWSEVLALDMRSGFGKNLMNKELGAKYRKLILERGGEVAPGELVEAFLGRKSNSDAFVAEITGK